MFMSSRKKQVKPLQTHISPAAHADFVELRQAGKGLSAYRLAQALILEGIETLMQAPPDERPGKIALLLSRHGIPHHRSRLDDRPAGARSRFKS